MLELRRERVDARDLVVELRIADDHPLEAERVGLAVDLERSFATLRRSSSASFVVEVNSPAESGLKISAESPAGVSEHSVWSVTAAVESANSSPPPAP